MLRSLLSSPEPRDPQDAEVAKMMLNSPAAFAEKASEWAVRYAEAPPRNSGSTSDGMSVEAIRNRRRQERKEKVEAEVAETAQYVYF